MDARFDPDAIKRGLAEVDLRGAVFEHLPLHPLHREWFRQRAWVRTVHCTTRIERNTLSALEVEQLLDDRASRALPRKDALEVLDSPSALAFVDDVAGDPAIVAAALAHLELVAIHPFNDGNGRTARALSRLLLVRGGCALDGIVSLDAWLDLRKSDYFAAIRDGIGRSYAPGYDATPFVMFFLRAIAGAADHVLARSRSLGEVQIGVRRDVASGNLPAMLLDGLVYARINRSLRPADYQRVTGRAPSATSRDLAAAKRFGYLIGDGAASNDRRRRNPSRALARCAAADQRAPRHPVPRPGHPLHRRRGLARHVSRPAAPRDH